MNVAHLISNDVKQDNQEGNDEEEEGEIVLESRNFSKSDQGGCGTEFQYFDASAYAKNITPTNAFVTSDIKGPCFHDTANDLYPCDSSFENNHSLSFPNHSFLPLPTLQNSFLSPTTMGNMSTCVSSGSETELSKDILEEKTLYRNSMCIHFISVWIVLKEFDFSIILNTVKKATVFFTVKSFIHRHHGHFFILYFESNLDAYLAIQALTHLTFLLLNTTNRYNVKPFNFSRINQVTPLTFHLFESLDKNSNCVAESLTLPHLQYRDSYNGSDAIYCSKDDETKRKSAMEDNEIMASTCLPCGVKRKSDCSLKDDSIDEILQQGSYRFNDMEQKTHIETMATSYQHYMESMIKGYGSDEEGYETLKYLLPRCLTNPILKNFYFTLLSKKHYVHFPASYWCEHATFDVQMKDYENLLHQYSLKNRYLLFKNLPNELSNTNELKLYFLSKGLELQKFQMEIIDQTSNTVTAHVAFKTKKEAYDVQRLLVNHVTGNEVAVEFCGPRSASHTLWIGNLTNVSCEWIVSKGFNEFLHSFQGLSRLRVLPEKNCAFATFETKQQAVIVRNFCHGLLFGYLGNKVRLNVDFTVAVNEAEQLPVPKHHCEFCLWRYTANDDISVKKPFITVPPHLEFFLHDSSHTSSIDEKNTELDIELMAPSQNLEISHSPLMSLESGSTAIEATRNTNVMLQENKTVNVANELTDVNVTGERIQTPMSTNEATKNVKDTAQSKKHVTVIKMEGERDEIRCQGKKKTSNANEIKANRHVVNKVRKSFKKDEQKKMLQGLNEKAKNNKEIQERLKTAEATYEGFKTPKKNHKGFQNLEEINEKFINARTNSEQGTNFKQINKGLKNATEINKQKKNFKEGTRSTKCVNVTIEKLENVNVMNHGHKGESHKSTENQHLCGRKEREENVNVMSEREENQCTTTQEKDNVNFRNLTVETANAMKKGTENMTEFKIIKESGRERFEDENSNFEPQKRKFFLCQNTEERKKEEKEIPLSTTGLRCSVANISKSGLDVKTLNPTRLDEDDKIQVEQDEKTILSGQHVQISEEKSERFETICTKIKESLSKCSSSKKKMLGGVVGKDGIEVSRKKTTDVNKSSTECVFLQHTNEIKLGKKNEKDIFSKASDTKKLITIKGMNTKKIPLSKAKRAVFFSGTNTAGMEGISYNSSETTNIRRCVNLRNVKESMINIKTEKIPSCVMTVNKNSRKKNKEHTSVLEKETFPNETKLLRKNEVVTCSELAEGASAHDVLVSQNTQPQRKRPFPSEEKGCATSKQDMKSALSLHSSFLPDENDTISIPKLKKKIACRDSVKNITSQTIQPSIQSLVPQSKEPPTSNVDQDENVCQKISSSPRLKKHSMEIEEMFSLNNKICNAHKVGKQATCIEGDTVTKHVVHTIESIPLQGNIKEESEGQIGNPTSYDNVFQKKDLPCFKENNPLKRQLLREKKMHWKQKNGSEKKNGHITNSTQQKDFKMNHIVLLSEKKEEDVQKKNVSSVVKGTCQLMKQGQFVCLVNYQFKQGKIEQNLPTILDVSARTTITILHERVQQKCNELTIWQLLPLEDAAPYETLCEYFKSRNRIGLVESCKKTIFLVPLKDSSEILNLHVNKMTLFAVVINGCLLKPKRNS